MDEGHGPVVCPQAFARTLSTSDGAGTVVYARGTHMWELGSSAELCGEQWVDVCGRWTWSCLEFAQRSQRYTQLGAARGTLNSEWLGEAWVHSTRSGQRYVRLGVARDAFEWELLEASLDLRDLT